MTDITVLQSHSALCISHKCNVQVMFDNFCTHHVFCQRLEKIATFNWSIRYFHALNIDAGFTNVAYRENLKKHET